MNRLGLYGWGAVLLRVFIPVIAVAVVGCTDGSSDEFTGTTLDYELAATTVVVDQNTSASVVSVGEDGSIVVEAGSDLGGQVSTGTVLLFQRSDVTPNGLLRKVTSVSTDGDRLVLTTEQATLEDAFDEFHLVMNETVESSSSALQMRSAIPGVTHKRIGGSGSVTYTDKVDFDKTVLYDHDGNKKTTGDQVVLDGSLSFSFGIRMEVDIGWGGLKEFAYTPVLKQKAQVEVSTTLAKWSEEEEIVVATFAVPFTAWVVPMLFNLDIVIGAEGRLEARLSTGMSLEASADSGVLYKDGKWSLTGGTRVDFDYDPPTLDASASLKGYVGLRGELLICGVVGPELTIDGYLELSADINGDPWWELVAGLEGFVGIKGEILGAVLFEFESDDFIKQKVTLADADGPFGSSTCISDCGTRECGLDPVCGTQNCGTCDHGYSCQDGECVEDTCVPDCGSAECGLDPVCGTQNCGTCDDGYSCQDGECVQDTGWEPDDYTVNCGADGMCFIPAGLFWMGCNSTVDSDCYGNESPYHEVTLSGYYIDKTEVTQGEYKKCVDAGECNTPSDNWDPIVTPNRPVVYVDWNDATAYCAWAGKRLPTEAEWEKAARGTDGRKYPWGNEDATCDYAVMDDGGNGCGTGSTWDVCGKSPAGDSPYGLCDMAGNVWEWVSDWYGSDYYSNSPSSNPTGPDSGSGRVRRGGSFVNDYDGLRASNRIVDYPSYDSGNLGFRCSRSQ